MRRHLVFALIAVLCLGLMPATVLGGDEFRPGAPGLDDPYFPLDGNGGYDVDHYGLDVRYEPAIDMLTGTATIEATATHALSQFNLDFVGLTIDAITVNDRAATWSRDEGELTVQPHRGIRADEEFTAVIRYSGVPETITDEFGMSGFMHTDDGALILGQPHVAATWFPANDHPLDKASFTFRLTVPAGTEAIANGSLVGTRTRGGWSTWTWDAPDPMATYLAGVAIGQFDVRAYREDGIRYWDALDTDLYDEVYGPPNAGELGPRTGIQFVWSQAYDEGGDAGSASYKRLSRVIDVPVGGATMSFWTERETEPGWDFLFVESRTVGADDWTTHEAAPHTSTDVGACPISFNPFLEHYLSLVLVNEGDPTTPDDDEYECRPTGTSGVWNAASGASTDWEQWTVALPNETGAARQVEVSISYASDGVIQGRGVVVDDIVVSTGQGSTSFEEDGNVMDGWVVAPPPAGSQAPNNWIVTDVTGVPPPPPPTPSLGEVADDSLARQPEVVDFLSDIFGPYPFKVAGGIVDDADELGFALETQTRPIYSKWFFSDQISGDLVVVHELAHQWAGDSMTIGRWQDIWLNEGFATYAEWLWLEAQGLDTAQSIFEGIASMPADDPAWTVRTGDPGPEALFDFFGVYLRGGMTLHALRLEVGDKDFFRILREWNRQQGGGHVTTPEFIALAERVSGEQLDSFFDAWLYTPEKPAGLPEATPGPEPAAALLLEALRVRDGETAPSTGPRPFLPSASGFDSSRLRK